MLSHYAIVRVSKGLLRKFMRPHFSNQHSCDQGLSQGLSELSLTDSWWNPLPFLENHAGKGGEVLLSFVVGGPV